MITTASVIIFFTVDCFKIKYLLNRDVRNSFKWKKNYCDDDY